MIYKELSDQPKQLYKLSQIIQKGLLDLDDLSEIIPGMLHINSRADLALEYMSKTGQDIIRYSMEELDNLGSEVLERHQSRYTLEVTYPKLFDKISCEENDNSVSFFQDWTHNKNENPFLVFTTSKILNNDQLISITLFPQKIEELSKNINSIIGVNVIFERYYQHYLMLTKREKEVLNLLSKELSRNEISQLLFIDPKTVKKHCENIFKKLGTNKRTEIKKIADAFRLI